MTDPMSVAPPHVQAAARTVQTWLDEQNKMPAPRSDRQADWAERLNRCRQFDQSHHGLKEAAGFVRSVDHPQRAFNDLPPPLRGDAPMRPDPHRAGPRGPVGMPVDSRRPANDMPAVGLLPTNGCLNSNPHPPTPAAQVQEANTYGLSRVPRR